MSVRISHFSAFLLLFVTLPLAAREKNIVNVGLQARVDYQREGLDGSSVSGNCGFKGKNVSLVVNGALNEHFSYNYRQRLYRGHGTESLFKATDFLHLTYRPDERWVFSAGKQILEVGGYEYDLAPIDAYFISEFTGNIGCYQLGASAGLSFGDGKDLLRVQFCQSPFCTDKDTDMYAYNLVWNGTHGRFSSVWTMNLIEYLPGELINYIALGNRFVFGRMSVFLDFQNRSFVDKPSFLRDLTLIGKASYSFSDRLNVFGKASYDRNDLDEEGDWCVLPGTSIGRVGAGVEYFPLADDRIRLHATFCHSFGKNGNALGNLLDNQQLVSVGLTWRMSLLGR